MRVVLSGGGTGGHITPILAVANQLKERKADTECFYLGESGAVKPYLGEDQETPFKAYNIKAGKWRRYKTHSFFDYLRDVKTLLLNARDFFRLIAGFAQSLYYLWRIKPDVVFVKGGYVGLPVGLAAWIWRLPLVIHESDARPGLTNRILARFAQVIAVGFPKKYYPNLPQGRLHQTGIPLRSSLFGHISPDEAKKELGLSQEQPVLLVMGGSGGASKINQAVVNNLEQLCGKWQVLHLSGHRHYSQLRPTAEKYDNCYRLWAFTDNMALFYAAADIVITRGGANSLAELAAFKLPAIVVPAAQLFDQERNAEVYQKGGAVIVAREENLENELPDLLAEATDQKRQTLAKAIARFDHLEAAGKVADLIISCGNQKL